MLRSSSRFAFLFRNPVLFHPQRLSRPLGRGEGSALFFRCGGGSIHQVLRSRRSSPPFGGSLQRFDSSVQFISFCDEEGDDLVGRHTA